MQLYFLIDFAKIYNEKNSKIVVKASSRQTEKMETHVWNDRESNSSLHLGSVFLLICPGIYIVSVLCMVLKILSANYNHLIDLPDY